MKLTIRRLMLLIAGSALLLATVLDIMFTPGHQEIHSMGNLLVSGVEKWRTCHGRYPSSLAEAGLGSPTRYLGGFRYQTDPAGSTFILSIGRANGSEFQHDYDRSNRVWSCHD